MDHYILEGSLGHFGVISKFPVISYFQLYYVTKWIYAHPPNSSMVLLQRMIQAFVQMSKCLF